MSGPRVVVTGSAGFLGSHVRRALIRLHLAPVGLDLRAEHPAERIDVRSPVDPRRFEGAAAVVHLAALGGVAGSLRDPDAYQRTNVEGTAHVLDAALRAGVPRAVVASSSSVYGECPEPAAEARDPAPMSPYARTKLEVEEMSAALAGADLEVVAVRPFTVIGPGQRPDMLLARLLRGEELDLWRFTRDFTPVSAVADAIARACAVPVEPAWQAVNLGAGRPIEATALLSAVAEATGRAPTVRWGPPRPGEPRRTWADTTRAERLLGFRAEEPLLETIAAQAADTARRTRATPATSRPTDGTASRPASRPAPRPAGQPASPASGPSRLP